MKLHIANYEPDRQGGGWTFARNLASKIDNYTYEEADTYFIAGASMVGLGEVKQAKDDGKRVILRVDNATRNSRNKRNGMDRMKSKAEIADLVIYQSRWARDYLSPFLETDGPVILNGCNLDMFNTENKIPNTYLYSRFNRDETKNWEVARYWFSQHNKADGGALKLYIVGNFSEELRNNNFDFYMGERLTYTPALKHQEYADLLNVMESFIYTYYNDACSNSLIEALCSGCKIVGPKYFRNTGGATEIREAFRQNGREYFSLDRMADDYLEVLR